MFIFICFLLFQNYLSFNALYFLASVSYIHFAITGKAALYCLIGFEAVLVAFFLGVVCSLLYCFVAVVIASLRVMVVEFLRDILAFEVLLLELQLAASVELVFVVMTLDKFVFTPITF